MTIKEFINPARIFIKTKEGKGITLDKYLAKRKIKKLWENPNHTVDFNGQNVTFSNGDYDFLVFTFKGHRSNMSMLNAFTIKGEEANANFTFLDTNKLSGGVRNCTYVNDTTYHISDCHYQHAGGNEAVSNGLMVPYKIYGGKF